MEGNLDITRSLAAERIRYSKRDIYRMFDRVLYLAPTIIFSLLGVFMFAFLAKRITYGPTLGGLLVVSICIVISIFGFLCLYSLVYDNKLIRIKGALSVGNIDLFRTRINEHFGILLTTDRNIFRKYIKRNWWNWETRVLVLIDGDDALINISRFNERNMKSPFHPIFDNMKIRSLLK